MTRLTHAIDLNVPAHVAYEKLLQFESYPSFMQGVTTVHRVDDRHLHWSGRMMEGAMEWDAEVTEQREDKCIEWRSTSGPPNTGRIELQETGGGKARVTLSMECDPRQVLASQDGDAESALQRQLAEDLARFKNLVETSGAAGQGKEGFATRRQVDETTQSEASLSRQADDAEDEGAFQVAEEQNFDAQSAQARRVGHMPQESRTGAGEETDPSSAIAESMHPDAQEGKSS